MLRRGMPVGHLWNASGNGYRHGELPEETGVIVVAGVTPSVVEEIEFSAGEREPGRLIDPGLNGDVVEICLLYTSRCV